MCFSNYIQFSHELNLRLVVEYKKFSFSESLNSLLYKESLNRNASSLLNGLAFICRTQLT